MDSDLELCGFDLLSKFGFSDGELLYEYFYEHDVALPGSFRSNDLLIHLVEKYLIPEVERFLGFEIIMEHVATSHNPIRLKFKDSEKEKLEHLIDVWVRIPKSTLLAELQHFQ